ncbi:Protein ELF4-LIKE 2 [Platanthera zijinensis]|uniref:Protein ELF4-LIKE 2 n=1 Tax=Platanthera zijinensis TaxID=2320716 RepID=A0AAP0FXU7_9ASPA
MEGDAFSDLGNATLLETKAVQRFHRGFVQAQAILDQNRLLISEIIQNHRSMIADGLSRNARLIRELNNNIRLVAELYAGLSVSFAESVDACFEAAGALGSDDKARRKRIRSG